MTGGCEAEENIFDNDLALVEQCVQKLRLLHNSPQEDISHLLDYLNGFYANPKTSVRFKIVYEVSRFACPESVALLTRALIEDESPLVRHEAASGLGEIGDLTVIPILVNFGLRDSSPIVRHEAAMALDSIGDETVLLDLRRCLSDEDPIVVASCEVAISSILFRKGQSQS